MLNIGPDLAHPDALAELGRWQVHGIDTFILMSDDPGLIRRYGTEVGPAARELLGAQ